MNFADFHMTYQFNTLIILKKTHALGRSLVIFKIPVSRS
ncbi:preprotein translocase subunit SecY [Salmonella enterica]|uniref:Preprotein translocase subunit SecY n=1 Tax=Salmonella enterica subsp. enterica serovar Gaminara TaxID=913070 RepID=A0A2T8WWZ7_SALET|nr:preprotein translocase subunit SecY [Salmonella enterica]EDO5352456.1 preprotein translocase subunit SecY [Salmonella enterica subsp. enterica serovar Gaminara]EAP3523133.1 preprotein translocase subunit SecY [Salmonella enterica]EAQ0348265.1 preprotein translocase subunit SecY [Salmonella enterica]EAQ0896504.1 preprotein translocase subunit SecY [Salmonella enterica]